MSFLLDAKVVENKICFIAAEILLTSINCGLNMTFILFQSWSNWGQVINSDYY